jgi:hypothetical protein
MLHRTLQTALLTTLSLGLLSACDGVFMPPDDGPAGPQIHGLSKDSLQVGETLWIIGQGFPEQNDGETLLEFSGAFIWNDDNGNRVVEDVPSFTVAAVFDGNYPEGGTVQDKAINPGQQLLRWNRFGPFEVPFGGGGSHTGTFRGEVTPIVLYADGTSSSGQALEVAIEVQPSIIITRFEPVIGQSDGAPKTPNCSAPALRVFGGMPYVLEVQALDFVPEYFLYEISNINGTQQWTEFTHAANGTGDRLGDPTNPSYSNGEIVVFNQLTDDVEFALSTIRVTAVDANNNSIETAMPVPIVRPISFHHDGKRHLAEYYEPVPVYGPIVGGIGTTVTYAESQTESRQNAVSVAFTRSVTESAVNTDTQSWDQGYGITETQSSSTSEARQDSESVNSTEAYGTTYSSSEQTSTQVSSTNGTEWGYNLTQGTTQQQMEQEMELLYGEVSGEVATEVNGGVSIPGVANVGGKVGTTVGASTGQQDAVTTGTTVGQSTQEGSSTGGNQSETQQFGSVTSDSRSESVGGSYGVSSQTSISTATSESNATAESVTYNMGAATTVSEGYSVGNTESWSETWVNTSSQTNLLSFSGKVPNGRCAVVYRQTIRYVREAKLYKHDLCGVREKMSDLVFNEWAWSPNISIDLDSEEGCGENPPVSTQPAAECFRACD